jgi:hypothetical protein
MHRNVRRGLIATLILAAPAVAQAQGAGGRLSKTTGLSLGASLTGASFSTAEDGTTTTESGAGFQVEAMYGLNKRFSVGLEYARANIDAAEGLGQYALSHIGGVGRLFFRDDTKRARPYVEGVLLRREIASDIFDAFNVKARSIGGGLGGGVQIFAKPTVAFDVSGQYASGSFGDWTANGESFPFADMAATSFTFRVGARFLVR